MTARRRSIAAVALLLLATLAAPGLAAAQDGDATRDGAVGCEYPVSVTDATGTNVTLESAPERVATLQPSDAQTMWEIGARDQVVAMPQTQYTSYLDDRGNRTGVKNDDLSVDVEVVTNTSADLVLAANATRIGTVEKLRQAGMTVYHFGRASSIEDVYAQVNTTGRLTGNCEGAAETVASMQSTVASVSEAVDGRDRPRVLYYFFGYTTGNETHIHDLIRTAGGTNVAAQAGLSGYVNPNEESVVAWDPQWIVYPSDATVPASAAYNSTTAIRQNQTLSVNTYYVSQPAPRIVRPLRTMAEAFHPAAFDGNATTATATNTDPTATDATAATNATATTDATPTGGNGPGFGAVTVALACLALAGLGSRGRSS